MTPTNHFLWIILLRAIHVFFRLWPFFTLVTAIGDVSSPSGYWKDAPWQTSSSGSDVRNNILEQSRYQDLPPTVFSPTGRLFAVEKVVGMYKSPWNPRSNIVVAMHFRKGILIVSTLITSPHLRTIKMSDDDDTRTTGTDENNNDNHKLDLTTSTISSNSSSSSSSSPLFLVNQTSTPIVELTCNILAATAGNAVDGKVLKSKLLAVAGDALEEEGGGGQGFSIATPTMTTSTRHRDHYISPSILARRLADHLQLPTQTMGGKVGRMLASSAVIVGHDQIWRIDPTGQFWKCHAVVLGQNADKGEATLYRALVERMSSSSLSDDGNENENCNHNHNHRDLDSFLQTLTSEQALELACDCIRNIVQSPEEQQQQQPQKTPPIYWKAVVLDYSDHPSGIAAATVAMNRPPKRIIRRGTISHPSLHNNKDDDDESKYESKRE